MKRIIIGTITSMCLLTSASAYDNYLKQAIFYTVPSDLELTNNSSNSIDIEMKSGYALEVAYGLNMSKELDIELQYTYDKSNVKDVNANIKVHSLFLNAIYKLDINSKSMHPYLGIGLGYISYSDGTISDEVLGYQGFLGTSFDVDYNMETFVEYKYKDFSEVELDELTYDNTSIHAIGVGLKTKF